MNLRTSVRNERRNMKVPDLIQKLAIVDEDPRFNLSSFRLMPGQYIELGRSCPLQ